MRHINLSNTIKQLRMESGLTQNEFATKLHVSTSSVAMWERGERFPTRKVCERIADLYDVSIDYLYGRTMQCKQSDQQLFLERYSMLNETGKERMREYLEDLLLIDKYRKR